MEKFTCSKFELDLTNYNMSIVDENHWFSDRFLTKQTLPITVTITDELNEKLGDILSYNSDSSETIESGYCYHLGVEHEAVLEIEDITGREASISIRFGYEDLPNHNTKLSELALDYVNLDDTPYSNIYDYANSVVSKSWPEVSHNFTAVHVDKFDTDSDQWQAFEGLLNKRVGSAFIENEYDAVDDLQLNRNIMQPQPYLMHVLEVGFAEFGRQITGDLVNDVNWKKALFSEVSEYYSTINGTSDTWLVEMSEFSSEYQIRGNWYGDFFNYYTLPSYGRYRIAGNLFIRKWYSWGAIALEFGGEYIVKHLTHYEQSGTFYYQVDIVVEYISGDGIIGMISEGNRTRFPDGYQGDISTEAISDLTITKLSSYDGSGNFEPSLVAPDDIKLTECVPDMTFGDLMTILKNWKNLDLDFSVPDYVGLNYIHNQLAPADVKDLRNYEIKAPLITKSSGDSYLLKFQDITSDEYSYDQVFIEKNKITINNFTTNDDTSEISINAVPLPIIERNGVKTAHHFVDDSSKLKLIFYNGTGGNLAQDPFYVLIQSIYESDYQEWLNIRLTGSLFKWSFKMTEENLRDLKIRNKVYCYKNNNIIKSVAKDLVSRGIWNVEAEILTLK
ncbi:hypothetical protein ACFFVB_18560 [Formosa undariae]|uniref:Uncharacterized protein n=1 Tax=Formosa undariae TaxID=1325436 RepID=A0ABV5F6L2_9FLAO